jgi:hypothetical protein
VELNIGKEFSQDPTGRFYSDGTASGEHFREDVLKPKLSELADGEKLTIVLDYGVDSYGSSFLSEGFAGMVKFGYITAANLLDKLDFEFSDPDYEFFENRIREYIRAAKYGSKQYVMTPRDLWAV